MLAVFRGPFAFGVRPTLTDVCMVPRLGDARHFGIELRWPWLVEIKAACAALPAFSYVYPDVQSDVK